MTIPQPISDLFYQGLPSEKTQFGINASVVIVGGVHLSKAGTVISLLSIEPTVTYLIELGSGEEKKVNESDLAPLSD